jgi:hypothetical protein
MKNGTIPLGRPMRPWSPLSLSLAATGPHRAPPLPPPCTTVRRCRLRLLCALLARPWAPLRVHVRAGPTLTILPPHGCPRAGPLPSTTPPQQALKGTGRCPPFTLSLAHATPSKTNLPTTSLSTPQCHLSAVAHRYATDLIENPQTRRRRSPPQ